MRWSVSVRAKPAIELCSQMTLTNNQRKGLKLYAKRTECCAGRIGGGPLQPFVVSARAERETRGQGPGLVEIAGCIQAPFLGWAVGYPICSDPGDHLEPAVPLGSSLFSGSGGRAVFVLPANGGPGV